MSLYPSLEDMKVDQMGRAQVQLASEIAAMSQGGVIGGVGPTASAPPPPYPLHPPQLQQQQHNADLSHMYPALDDYMGLEFTQEIIAANMPEYLPVALRQPSAVAVVSPSMPSGVVAPISGASPGLHRAAVTNAIREVTLCKDGDGKVGMRVRAIQKGIFVCLVKKHSPAALAGLRFGDQILEINGVTVAGFTMDKVHDLLKKCSSNGIKIAVRDRPFERSVTLHKDSTKHIGFQFKEGEVTAIVKDSSAARNGLLIDHQLLEINGQNVVGVKDKDISGIINEAGDVVTVTIMPGFVYKHMMKHMASSLVKFMDHSIPDM